LERKRLGVDKNGFSTDKNGGTLVAGGDLTTRTGIKDFLKKAGVNDDAEATRITNEFANSKGEIDYFSNAGQMKYGGANSTISQALLKAAEKYTFAGKPIGGAADDDITTQKTKYDLLKGTKELTTTTGSNKTVVKTDESGQVVKATTTLNNVTDGIRSPSAAPAPAPTPANSGQTVLVKIDLGNGRSYDVNTASANDASQLTDFMNALQNAKRGAGM
jgi:hypothetical protein